MAFFYDLIVFQENNPDNLFHQTPPNTESDDDDKYFNIMCDFNNVLQLSYPENVQIPYRSCNSSSMVPRSAILRDHEACSRSLISMLDHTGLPEDFIESTVSPKVLSKAWEIETDLVNLNRRVLTIVILISVVTLYDDRQEIDRAISESSSAAEAEATTRFTPASNDAIQRLEKVRLDRLDDESECTICLEKFSIGVETTRMPCGHLYHGECIVQWLETSHMCPLCRYQMP